MHPDLSATQSTAGGNAVNCGLDYRPRLLRSLLVASTSFVRAKSKEGFVDRRGAHATLARAEERNPRLAPHPKRAEERNPRLVPHPKQFASGKKPGI